VCIVKMGLHKRPGPAHFFSLCFKTHCVIFFTKNSQVSSASSSRAWPPTPESPPTALFIIRPLLPAIRSESPSRTRQARSSSSPAPILRVVLRRRQHICLCTPLRQTPPPEVPATTAATSLFSAAVQHLYCHCERLSSNRVIFSVAVPPSECLQVSAPCLVSDRSWDMKMVLFWYNLKRLSFLCNF